MSVIRCVELSKTYSRVLGKAAVPALHPLTMNVEEGEAFGFLGPNGAGKTTTIKILTGLLFPSGGTAELLGKKAGDAASRHRLGFLPEHPYFYDHLTGREILDYFGRLFGLNAAERDRRAKHLLGRVGLERAADQPLRGYSKGMLQRIGIAQALLNDPPLVILDEPMSGLDPVGRKEVRDLILELRAEKRSVFFSTHILSDVEVICDRIAILNKGRLVTLSPLADLMRLAGSEMEIIIAGLPPAGREPLSRVPGISVSDSGDRLVARVQQEHTGVVLEIARTHCASVLSMVPMRKSLEEIFMDRIEGVPQTAVA